MRKYFLCLLVWGLGLCASNAQIGFSLSDSARISLLTCSPGGSIEELFGHTAYRIEDPASGLDLIVNYGLFSFDQPHFIARFVKGETDYQCGANRPSWFFHQYRERGSSVTQQQLRLSPAQRDWLYSTLIVNMMPENATYRYNFIFNNCATKPRDLTEQCLAGGLHYAFADPTQESGMTFREAIKEYTQTASWAQFGFDLCLGAGTDRKATHHELLFLPERLQEAYANASVSTEDGGRPLVENTTQITPRTRVDKNLPIGPNLLFWSLFVITLLISVWGYVKQRALIGLDALLFTAGALAGSIVFFLVFFSEHPFTDHNYNLWCLNPLMFWPLLSLCIRPLRRWDWVFYGIWTISTALFIIAMPFVPQNLHTAMLPIAGLFLCRSVCRVLLHKKTGLR